MAKAYGEDLRSRVIAAVEGGMWRTAAAARFGVGKATAITWLRAWRDEGRSSAKPAGGDRRSDRIEAFGAVILAAVVARRDITLDELSLCQSVTTGNASPAARCVASSPGAASRSKKTAHASEQARPDVARRRQAWFDGQPDLDPERLIFIDESGASTKMTIVSLPLAMKPCDDRMRQIRGIFAQQGRQRLNRKETLHGFVERNVAPRAVVRTDGNPSYEGLEDHRHDARVVGNMAAHVVLKWVHRAISNMKRWLWERPTAAGSRTCAATSTSSSGGATAVGASPWPSTACSA